MESEMLRHTKKSSQNIEQLSRAKQNFRMRNREVVGAPEEHNLMITEESISPMAIAFQKNILAEI